jgi:hypothetical protein
VVFNQKRQAGDDLLAHATENGLQEP